MYRGLFRRIFKFFRKEVHFHCFLYNIGCIGVIMSVINRYVTINAAMISLARRVHCTHVYIHFFTEKKPPTLMPYRCLDGNEYSTTINNVEPADKYNVRRYIKGVCSAPKCADTFFLYLSSPTRQDGNALLWDANGNGLVSLSDPEFFLRTLTEYPLFYLSLVV